MKYTKIANRLSILGEKRSQGKLPLDVQENMAIKDVGRSNWEKPFSVAGPAKTNEASHYLKTSASAYSAARKSQEKFYSHQPGGGLETANFDIKSDNVVSDVLSQQFIGENVYVTQIQAFKDKENSAKKNGLLYERKLVD